MIITGKYLKTEPYTSAIDLIENKCQSNFKVRKGEKIARLNKVAPYHEIVVEMVKDGLVIMDWSERIAIVVEGNEILNMGMRLYNIEYPQYDMENTMMRSLEWGTGIDDEKKLKELIDEMLSNGIIAINEK